MSLEITHPDKLYFPEAGLSKGDVVDYYRRVAGAMLPHLRERPLMLHRFPEGLARRGFYQKEVPADFPAWIARETVPKEDGQVTHAVCNDGDTLVFLASRAVLTFHAWLSRRDRLRRPDRLVFDLDPPAGRVALAREGARRVRDLFHELGLVPFLMSTGSKGYHVVAPLVPRADFEGVRVFARAAAELLAGRHPDRFTVEFRKANRGGRLFLDATRNAYAQSTVAPYSLRALPGAPAAVPLDWGELSRTDPRTHHLRSVLRRLARKEDPWADMDRHARPLGPAWDALHALGTRG